MDNCYEALKLERQLCFPLYACAKEIVRRYQPFLEPLGLTYTQYIALLVLWEHKTLTVKALGEALYLDSGTLTPLLKKLEHTGLLTRTRRLQDERSVEITLTDAGLALREQAAGIPQKLGACIPVTPEEAQALYVTLYKILGKPTRTE
ncbi:MAG: MarR family transcriptional regulator [Oscillospiraceae bacterium]